MRNEQGTIGGGIAVWPRTAAPVEVPLRRRVARLGFLSLSLVAFTLGVLVVALLAERVTPRAAIGQLPLGPGGFPPGTTILAAGAADAAFFLGLASLHAAAARCACPRSTAAPT